MMDRYLTIIPQLANSISNEDRVLIHDQAKNKNMYYAIHCLNIYAFDLVKNKIDILEFKNINFCSEYIVNTIIQSYLEKFKESLYPSIFHEFNLLVENDVIENDLPRFIENTSNDFEWIEYYLEKYPVTLSILDKTIEYSISFLQEFMERLSYDMFEIQDKFNINIIDLESLNVFAGDNHNNQRSVLKLNFGRKTIYYKPRTLINEELIYDFFYFLQKEGLKKSNIIPRTLSRDEYGWMEGISFEEVKSEEKLIEFYFNQGINLAVFYVLNVSDLIGDNVIAHGEYPCYFDLECILQPNLNKNPNLPLYERNSEAANFIANSVLKTNILPQYAFVTNNFQGVSNSGLSIIDSYIPDMILKENKGKVVRVYEEIDFKQSNTNIPMFQGTMQKSSDFIETIIEGFDLAYDFIEKNKTIVQKYVNDNFWNVKIRVLHRATYIYTKLLNESFLPEYLNSFEKRKSLFENLKKSNLDIINNGGIIASEIKQLLNGDIPIFYTTSNSKDLILIDDTIVASSFLTTSGIEAVLNKMNSLNNCDKARQIELIELSFCVHEGHEIKQNCFVGQIVDFKSFVNNDKELNKLLIKDEIFYNNDKILKKGFMSKDEYSNYGLIQTPSYTWGISSQKWGLFDGLDGLSFFYLNMYKIFNEQRSLQIGKSFLETGINQFNTFGDYYNKLSGFNKISLFNYPLSTFYIAEFYLQEDIDIKFVTAKSIDSILEWIEKYYTDDMDFDLLGGGAGTIIYLLKLYDRTKDDRVLVLCEKIGAYIINNGFEIEEEQLCWVSKFGKAHIGMSHGSSGIALSLFKLDSYLGEEKFKEYAIKALNYERRMFDKDKKYWYFFKQILQNETNKDENHFWAYGSGGIALNRMLISKYYQDDELFKEIEFAVNNLVEKGWPGNFNYSSGVFGNIDVLNDYTFYKNDTELKGNLNSFVNELIVKKQQFEGWSCAPVGQNYKSNLEMNGFFTGTSGIANTLLNFIDYENTVKLFR